MPSPLKPIAPPVAAPGVRVSLQELLALRGEARRLDLAPRGKVLATRSGGHLSPFRGRGMEFDEARIYQPGDDPRNMDWRVTARAGRPHVKLFREERERPLWLLVDQGPAMRFGTRVAFKSVIAAQAAALLSWAAVDRGDRVGGLIFDEQGRFEQKPAARTHGLLPLLQALAVGPGLIGAGGRIGTINGAETWARNGLSGRHEDERGASSLKRREVGEGSAAVTGPRPVSPGGPETPALSAGIGPGGVGRPRGLGDLSAAAELLVPLARPGSLIVVLSDFAGLTAARAGWLARLGRASEVVLIPIRDPLEELAPPPGRYPVTDGRRRGLLDTGSGTRRQAWQDRFQAHRAMLEDLARHHRAHLLWLSTAEPVGPALALGLHPRRAGGGR